MKLLVLCPHPEGVAPAQRLKYEQYFDYFRANGYEVVVSPFMTNRFSKIVYRRGLILEKVFWTVCGYARRVFDIMRAPRYDVVYVFLWVTPLGPPIFEALLTRANKRIVYDIDDMVFMGRTSPANRLVARMKGRAKAAYLMKHARHVITCTPTLDAIARQYTGSTTDISSTVDTEQYVVARPQSEKRRLTIGWSGSHTTSEYLLLLEDVLLALRAELDFDVLVIGDESFRFRELPARVLAWRRETEVADLQQFDIGVYPLPDDEWVLGKSGLKAIQYMALGIPPVATAVGANHRVIENGVSGLLVGTDAEWVAALRLLLTDADLRARMGAAARERIEQYYSVRANRDRYLAIINSVAANATPVRA